VKFIVLSFFLISNILANKSLEPQDFSVQKFSGLWYEIARTGNSYQENCVASSVEYKLLEDETYDVFNRCFENRLDGKLIEYNGSAKKIQENNNSKLKMRYFYIFTKQYNIIYLNDYKTAVVANDDYSNLWIMSRTANINKDELNKIIEDLKNKIDTSKLIFTKLDPKGRYK
jgi:lipocalin